MSTEPATPIQACLNRIATGDVHARADLYRLTRDRLLVMTRALMVRFSRLRRWIESEDVLQNAMLRLDKAFEQISFDSTRAFLTIAAKHIRYELLDLIRHYFGAHGLGANHETPPDPALRPEEVEGTNEDDPSLLAEWAELHELIAELPEEEQEVVLLRIYHGLSVSETAQSLEISQKTVKRRYAEAKVWLTRKLGREIPSELHQKE